ncbi:MAG: hypothetical protein LBV14_13290 [Acidovorax sp.]|jgi:hypothetical protein|nr:hypothetical protein [Acidovorax sp.]
MSISSEVRKAGPYAGNGVATSFPFSFKVFQASDVVVILADPTGAEKPLVAGADYSVALNADQDTAPGGTIKKAAALANGYLLAITSNMANLQPLDLSNQGGFYPRVVNAAFDRATIQVQQVAEQVSRAVKVPISSSTNPDELVQQLHQDALAASAAAASASASETAAATSQGAAATSAASAASSASTATAKANSAAASATAAANSAAGAATSASAAKTSETNAASSAAAAAASQTAAKTSETNAASSKTAAAASQTAAETSEANAKTSENNAAGSATSAANSAAAAAKSAEDAANSAIGQVVKKTSETGAAILPEGTYQQRPTDIPNVGLVMRGSTTTGVPEFYSRQVNEWVKFGTPDFSTVPTTFCGYEILITSPHFRHMVWSTLYKKYVRAPWHQPGRVSHFLRDVPNGSIEVRSDIVLDYKDVPDLADYLGVPKGEKFVLDEARGEFLRNLDSGRGIDPGRAAGSWREDEIKSHNHWSGSPGKSDNYSGLGNLPGSGNERTAYTASTGGNETRPRSIAYRLAVTY